MRKLLIAIAIIGGVVSISLCGLYGWKQATALEDKLIAAIQYGFVALLALILDMLAIRVWVSGWRKCGAFIAFAALGCFLMTATTSLGGMVTRSDRVQAERQRVLDSKQDAQTRIAELTAERQQIGSVPYTTGAAVEADKRLAEAATAQRKAECGENNEKRGPNCKAKELAEAKALEAVATASANRAGTDRIEAIETELRQLRSQRATSAGVVNANPLGAAMALIFGSAAADAMTARQQAIFALIFDVALLAIMVGVEVLGHAEQVPSPAAAPIATSVERDIPEAPKPRLVSDQVAAFSVSDYIGERIEVCKGSKLKFRDVFRDYEATAVRHGKPALDIGQYTDSLTKLCQGTSVGAREIGGVVYLMNVRFGGTKQTARLGTMRRKNREPT
jgi:hypothetical protein